MVPSGRSTSTAAYSAGGLEEARAAVLREIRTVPWVPILKLTHAVLAKSVNIPAPAEATGSADRPTKPGPPTFFPTVTDDTVNRVLANLRASGVLKDQGWSGFEKSPNDSSLHETAYFKPLENIFESIINASEFRDTNLLRLKVVGTTSPVSDHRHSSAQPDGYMILKSSSIPKSDRTYNHTTHSYVDNTDDLVVFFEFKKGTQEYIAHDNASKVIWNMHHCMRDDARRRFVYGATIENNVFRMLYHDRSTLVSSGKFDWMKDHSMLVRIVLGFAACTTREQLGYDSTMRRVSKAPGIPGKVYEIDVHGEEKTKTFVTRRVIANFGPDAVCGRGTRVWAVIEKPLAGVDPNQEHPPEFVLKDSWIDADREREGHVLQSILSNDVSDPVLSNAMEKMRLDAREDGKLLENDSGRQHFLSVLLHGDVPNLSYGCGDRTHGIHRGGVTLWPGDSQSTEQPIVPMTSPSNQQSNSAKEPLAPSSVHSLGGVPEPKRDIQPARGSSTRDLQHYRIVFKESGSSLYDLRTFRPIFQSLLGAIQGIHYLYKRGYVHRDVSNGNVLFRRVDGSDPGRGILIDLEYAKRLVEGGVGHESITGTHQFMSVEVASQKFLYVPRHPAGVSPPIWRHSPLHDLESVWWLLVWLIARYGRKGARSAPDDWKNFDELFGESCDTAVARFQVCIQPLNLDGMAPSYVASTALWPAVIDWRDKLTNLMINVGRTYTMPTESHYAQAFGEATDCIQNLLSLGDEFLDAELQVMEV